MQAVICPKCGAPLQVGVTGCPYCGVGLVADRHEKLPVRSQPPLEVPAGWKLHKDAWHGFELAHPAAWHVMTNKGQISVREDVLGLTAAVVWPFKLPQPSTARQVAATFVAAGNQFAKGFQAWEQGSAAPDSQRISLRTRQVRSNTQIDGIFNILVEEENCIISGYEAPTNLIAARSPVLGQVLSTFRTAEMMPRQNAQEPSEGAFQIWLPKGWAFQASVNRRTVSGMGLAQFSAAYDAQSRVMTAMLSAQYAFQDVLGAFMGGFTGYEIAKFMPAEQFCVKNVAKYMAKEQKNFRLEMVTPRSDLAEIEDALLIQAGYPAGMYETSIAVMEMTYEENGARLRQRMRVGTQHQVKAANMFTPPDSIWTAMLIHSYRTPEGEIDAWEPVLSGILDTVQVNPQWQINEQQRVAMEQQRVQNYIANAQADMANRRAQISQTLSETSSLITSAYWERQPTYDRLSAQYSDSTLGVQNVSSGAGDVYKVPSGYDQYWVDGLGNLMGGSWMVTPDIDWKPLNPSGG